MSDLIRQKAIFYLSLIGFFGIFSTTISKSPVLPLFVNALGGNDATLGIIAAASPFAGIVLSFPVGFLSDRLGRKRLLVISSLIFMIAPLLYLLVVNPWVLIPIRFFHGMATAILGPVASALVVSWYPQKKGERLGIYSAATLFGRTIAPLIGGFIISYFAILGNLINYKAVYLVAFALALPVFVFSLVFPTKKEVENGRVRVKALDLFVAAKEFGKNKFLVTTSLMQMTTYFIYGVLETYFPLYLAGLNIPAGEIGLIFSLQVLAIALTNPLFGKLADRIDKRKLIILGVLILALVMSTVTYLNVLGLLIFESLLFGLGMSLINISTNTYTAEIVSEEKLGTSLGALSSIMDIGQSFGPFIVGMIIASYTIASGFLACTILAIIFVGIFTLANYEKQLKQLITENIKLH
ncbi:MFS transporter [Patescibacteria group bacterium]|nr:MFS transporter [Patescibacteria group bacterium]MCL5409671.1 MFS transporter [Patescibacteria group bacterium]